MPKPDLHPIDLATVAKGALLELFEINIAKIAENILDPKTKATKKRSLTLKLTFEPDADRRRVELTSDAGVTIAAVASHSSQVYLGKGDDGRAYLFPADPRQDVLWATPEDDNTVIDFKNRSTAN